MADGRSVDQPERRFNTATFLRCFQIAYALGVIFAGRLVDRLGCRRGYPIVTGLWSLAAMGHALVNSVFGFGVRAFLAWAWARAAIFPPRSRRRPSGFRRKSARWPRAFSTRAQASAPFLLPWPCRGWRCILAGVHRSSSPACSARSGLSGGRFVIARRSRATGSRTVAATVGDCTR